MFFENRTLRSERCTHFASSQYGVLPLSFIKTSKQIFILILNNGPTHYNFSHTLPFIVLHDFFSKWLLRYVILIEQNFWEFERYEIVCEQFSLNLAFEMYVTPVERLKLNL